MSNAVETRESNLVYKSLVDDVTWSRLVKRIVVDEELEQDVAEKIMNEALGFLKLVAENPGNGFSPAPLVDIGWHTFILYTREYAAFCEKIAGRFIHHMPTDNPDLEDSGSTGTGTMGTIQFMVDNGYPINILLWVTQSKADCTEGWGDRCESPCTGGQQCEGN